MLLVLWREIGLVGIFIFAIDNLPSAATKWFAGSWVKPKEFENNTKNIFDGPTPKNINTLTQIKHSYVFSHSSMIGLRGYLVKNGQFLGRFGFLVFSHNIDTLLALQLRKLKSDKLLIKISNRRRNGLLFKRKFQKHELTVFKRILLT